MATDSKVWAGGDSRTNPSWIYREEQSPNKRQFRVSKDVNRSREKYSLDQMARVHLSSTSLAVCPLWSSKAQARTDVSQNVFGMNVDVFGKEPRLKWFLMAAAALVVIVITVSLGFKLLVWSKREIPAGLYTALRGLAFWLYIGIIWRRLYQDTVDGWEGSCNVELSANLRFPSLKLISGVLNRMASRSECHKLGYRCQLSRNIIEMCLLSSSRSTLSIIVWYCSNINAAL